MTSMRLLLAGACLAISGLTSCTNDEAPPDAAAADLAGALTTGKLPAGLFQGAPQPEHDAVVTGMGEASRSVEVADVVEEEDTATVTLDWRWELEGHEWEYRSTAELTRAGTGWRATWEPSLVEPSLTPGERLEVSTAAAPRGDILGARGARIVTERPVVRFGVDKTAVAPRRAADSARRAARLLGVSPGPFAKAVRTAGEDAFVEAIVLRPEDARAVDPAYDRVPGAVAIRDELPLAPTREFAAAILGRVGAVTAELVEESEGRLRAGDVTGLSGLQQRYDEQLAGSPGVTVAAVEEDRSRELFTEAPVEGEPLRTTIDVRLQTEAERLLAVPEPENPGPAAAIVAVRPSTGAILAAASGPGADGLNVATYGRYPPGSTFKVVTSLALLRAGLTPDSTVPCPATVTVDGKSFENYDDYPAPQLGRITLREAVAHSCNTAFLGSRERLEDQALADAAASLGFGVDHDLGFPAYFGEVPPPRSETEAAADLIGQGTVLASPLAMATVAASAQAGRTVVPHLLEGFQPAADPATPLTSEEAGFLRELMRAVVTEGSGAFLDDVPGSVGAKTGTAEYGDPGPDGEPATHAWMIAIRGDLAVAVFVETGVSGSSTAGPLLERFLD